MCRRGDADAAGFMISWTPRSWRRTLSGSLASVRGVRRIQRDNKSGSGTKRSPGNGRHNSKRDDPFLNTFKSKMTPYFFKSDNKIGADVDYKVLRYTVLP